MLRYWSWMLEHSRLSLWLIALSSAVWLIPLDRLQFDSSSSSFIQSKSEEITYYEKTQKIFGNDELLLIGITSGQLLDRTMLERLREVSSRIEQVEGVRRVLSLTNMMDIKGQGDEVNVEPLIPLNLESLDIVRLRARLQSNPLLERQIISKDLRSTTILVFLENFERAKALSQGRYITRQVNEILSPLRSTADVFIGGLPEMEAEGTANMLSDLELFTPLTVALVTGLLLLSFRSWRGISLPLAAVLVSLLWTFGPMALIGRSMTITTLTLPSLLIANGSSYVIHFLAQYYQALSRAYGTRGKIPSRAGKSSLLNALELAARPQSLDRECYRAVLLETLNRTHVAVFISAITTMAGFASLVISPIPTIRDFGIFATWGVFLGYFFCITLVPLLLWHHRVPFLHEVPGKEDSHRHYLMERLTRFIFHRAVWIYGAAIVCIGWALWGLLHLQVHTDYLGYFRESSQIVKASRKFAERLAGLASFTVVIESKGERSVLDPEILRATEALQRSLDQGKGVDKTLSFVDSLKLLNRAFHSDDPSFYALPTDPAIIQDLVEFAESDPSSVTEEFLAGDHRTMRILVRTTIFRSTELRGEFERIERQGRELFPPDVRVHSTGTLVLMNQTSDNVAKGQVQSLLLSTLLISSIVIVLFRSVKVGFLSLIPAGLPVLFFFGLLGWTGTPLNINTSVIANISIGIAVDNCIHYLVHFRHNVRKQLSIAVSMRESLINAGAAMIPSAVALTFGFLIFGASRFVPVSQFGLLSASVMGANLVATIFLLPALMLLLRRETLEKIPSDDTIRE